MNEYYSGILFLIIVTTIYYISFSKGKNNEIRVSLAFIILAGFLLRLFVSQDLYLHDWDERYHALVAKNMIDNPLKPLLYADPILPYDYKNWASNHIWLHKQPFPLWTIAFSMGIFGINEFALRLPSILFSTVAIYFTFYIGRYFYNNKVGLLAAFFHSINGLVIEITGGRVATDHPDILFFCLIELAVLLGILQIQKNKIIYSILTGVTLGLAILTKWLPALIILPIWILLAINSKKYSIVHIIKNISIGIIAASIISLPWQLYIHTYFPNEATWESRYNWMHIFETLGNEHAGGFFYHFNKMRVIWGEFIYLPIGWFIYHFIKRKELKKVALLCWIFIPYFFFSFVATKMQGYILFTGPAIFILLSWHCVSLYHTNLYFNKKWLSKLILLMLIVLPIRYSFERVKPFKKNNQKIEWTKTTIKMGKTFNGNKVVLFNTKNPIEVMFYTNFIAYSSIPDKEKIEELIANGYKILIDKNGQFQLPKNIGPSKNIIILN